MFGKSLSLLNRPVWWPAIETISPGKEIPKLIHQTFSTKEVPPEIRQNINSLRALNPGWSYSLYDDDDIAQFIRSHFGAEVLRRYESINPLYGAARADLFRYLLLYKSGGVYLDIKSAATRPFSSVLRDDDQYLLATWPASSGDLTAWGRHPELSRLKGGEFQQWYIVAAPGHPFLKAVIETVLRNIDVYVPALNGVGKTGVLRVTGPIAYTLAIAPLMTLHPHRLVDSEKDLGLQYSIYTDATVNNYKAMFKAHYAKSAESIILLKGARRKVSDALMAIKQVMRTIIGRRP